MHPVRGPLLPSPRSSRVSIVRLVEAVAAAPHALSVERRTLQSSAAEEVIAVGDVEEATVLDADGACAEQLRPEQQLAAVVRLSFGEAGLLLLEAGRTVPWVISSLEGPHTSLAKGRQITQVEVTARDVDTLCQNEHDRGYDRWGACDRRVSDIADDELLPQGRALSWSWRRRGGLFCTCRRRRFRISCSRLKRPSQ